MTVLDTFIAQDPSRDFIDIYSSTRWTELMVRDRTEAILEGMFPVSDQRILARKVDGYTLSKVLALSPDPDLVLPPYPMSVAEKAQVQAFGQVSVLCGMLKDFLWARAQILSGALDYESIVTVLNSFPPVEEGVTDLFADARSALQSLLDAFSQDVKDLVALRDAYFNPQPPEQP